MKPKYFVIKCIGAGFLVLLAAAVFGWVVMLLWNWLVPDLFNGPVIGFWQAAGLLVLCKLLFGGMRFKGSGRWGRQGYWKQRFEEKFAHLSPEEREKLKQEFASKCGHWKFKMEYTDEEKKQP
ncbi:MAG: hypothetical protein AB1458_01760 [Bacteroidota bacterium]